MVARENLVALSASPELLEPFAKDIFPPIMSPSAELPSKTWSAAYCVDVSSLPSLGKKVG